MRAPIRRSRSRRPDSCPSCAHGGAVVTVPASVPGTGFAAEDVADDASESPNRRMAHADRDGDLCPAAHGQRFPSRAIALPGRIPPKNGTGCVVVHASRRGRRAKGDRQWRALRAFIPSIRSSCSASSSASSAVSCPGWSIVIGRRPERIGCRRQRDVGVAHREATGFNCPSISRRARGPRPLSDRMCGAEGEQDPGHRGLIDGHPRRHPHLIASEQPRSPIPALAASSCAPKPSRLRSRPPGAIPPWW